MLRRILKLFFVSLVLEMNISFSLAFAITLSAAIGHDVWQNTTDLILSSPFERYVIENQTQVTPGTRRMPHPLRSAVSDRTATAAYHTTSALVTAAPTTITLKAPTQIATFHMRHLSNATNTQVATGHTGTNRVALTTTHLHSHTAVILTDATSRGDTTKALVKALTKRTNRYAPSNVSTINHSDNTVVPSHATKLDHEPLSTTTNATIIAWAEPCNITTPPTPMPKPRDTAFSHFINKVKPYLEAFGILDVVWNVGKFVHAKIQMFRSKRSKLPVAE